MSSRRAATPLVSTVTLCAVPPRRDLDPVDAASCLARVQLHGRVQGSAHALYFRGSPGLVPLIHATQIPQNCPCAEVMGTVRRGLGWSENNV